MPKNPETLPPSEDLIQELAAGLDERIKRFKKFPESFIETYPGIFPEIENHEFTEEELVIYRRKYPKLIRYIFFPALDITYAEEFEEEHKYAISIAYAHVDRYIRYLENPNLPQRKKTYYETELSFWTKLNDCLTRSRPRKSRSQRKPKS